MDGKKNSGKKRKRSSARPRIYSARTGRTPVDAVVAQADAAAGEALIRLSRSGAGVIHRREEARYASEDRTRSVRKPRRMSDTGIAQMLHVGSDARGIQKLAARERPIARHTSAKAVEELIKSKMLPGYSTWLVPLNEGHARLLAPFELLLEQLREMGPCAEPDQKFRRRLRRHVVLYRAAVKSLAEAERDERHRFQHVRDELIRSLLCVRARLLAVDCLKGDKDLRRFCRQAALRGAKFLKVVADLKSLHVQVRPAPRDIAAQWAAALFPAPGPDGASGFGNLFAWLSMNADLGDVDLHCAIALYRELTGDFGWTPADQAHDERPTTEAKWEIVGLYPTRSVSTIEEYVDSAPWELGPAEDFSEVREGDPAGYYVGSRRVTPTVHVREHLQHDELRFVRHLRRTVGDANLRAMLLLAMADRWYFLEDEADEVESDFEGRVFALCRWVKDLFPGRRMLKFEYVLSAVGFDMKANARNKEIGAVFLKRLINELSRCGVRRPVELNLDIPTPIPGRKQFWYAKRRKAKAKVKSKR